MLSLLVSRAFWLAQSLILGQILFADVILENVSGCGVDINQSSIPDPIAWRVDISPVSCRGLCYPVKIVLSCPDFKSLTNPDPDIFKSIGDGDYSVLKGGLLTSEVQFFYNKLGAQNNISVKSYHVLCLV